MPKILRPPRRSTRRLSRRKRARQTRAFQRRQHRDDLYRHIGLPLIGLADFRIPPSAAYPSPLSDEQTKRPASLFLELSSIGDVDGVVFDVGATTLEIGSGQITLTMNLAANAAAVSFEIVQSQPTVLVAAFDPNPAGDFSEPIHAKVWVDGLEVIDLTGTLSGEAFSPWADDSGDWEIAQFSGDVQASDLALFVGLLPALF